jgi:WD40 repeat protein
MSAPTVCVLEGHDFHAVEVVCAVMKEDNTLILSGGLDGTLCISNISGGQVLKRLKLFTESIETLAINIMFNWVVLGSLTGKLKVIDLNSYTERSEATYEGGIVKLIWPPSSLNLFVSTLDSKLDCLDVRDLTFKVRYAGLGQEVMDFQVNE